MLHVNPDALASRSWITGAENKADAKLLSLGHQWVHLGGAYRSAKEALKVAERRMWAEVGEFPEELFASYEEMDESCRVLADRSDAERTWWGSCPHPCQEGRRWRWTAPRIKAILRRLDETTTPILGHLGDLLPLATEYDKRLSAAKRKHEVVELERSVMRLFRDWARLLRPICSTPAHTLDGLLVKALVASDLTKGEEWDDELHQRPAFVSLIKASVNIEVLRSGLNMPLGASRPTAPPIAA